MTIEVTAARSMTPPHSSGAALPADAMQLELAAPPLPSTKPLAWAATKRLLDIILALLLLVLCAPALVVIAVAVCTSGSGPLIIGHERVGRGGVAFRCLKFRSMVLDADAVLARLLQSDPGACQEWSRSRKLRNDPRVTRVGAFLRVSSLDELPQLINVLRGEMSLVGPRPVVQEELDQHYGPEAAARYLSVRPGITGLWQISGRSDAAYPKRVALDLEYISRSCFTLDAAILLRTVRVVLLGRGAC